MVASAKPKVAILHQGCVPNYRRGFFDALAAESGVDYVVFHGRPAPDSGLVTARKPYGFNNVEVRNLWIPVLGRFLVYQPVLRTILFGDFKAAVIGYEIKYLSNLVLLLLFKLRRRPVLFWGFGDHIESRPRTGIALQGLLYRMVRRAKQALLSASSGYLAYTEKGRQNLMRIGYPEDRVWVLRNTIDLAPQIGAWQRFQQHSKETLRKELGLPGAGPVLLYMGRLVAGKRVDELIEAVRSLNPGADENGVRLLVVGDGPARIDLETQAEGLSVVRFLGAQDPESDMIGKCFRVASAMAIPGYVGLAVNHAFAHGVPVITREHGDHRPEIEFVKHDRNGLIVPGDEAAFVASLRAFCDDPETMTRLSKGALETRTALGLETMVSAFHGAVTAVLKRAS